MTVQRLHDKLIEKAQKDATVFAKPDNNLLAAAQTLVNQDAKITRLTKALNDILALGGNQPDAFWQGPAGPNDGRMRGDMFVSAKEIARDALGMTPTPKETK